MLKEILLNFGLIFCDVMSLLIFMQVILSWITGRGNKIYDTVYSLTQPFLSPLKRILPDTGMMDLSPIVAIFMIEILRSIWAALIGLL